MKMEIQGSTVRVFSIKELGAANATAFRDWVREAVAEGPNNIDIDLSNTTLLDSCGIGVLIALEKTARARKGRLRVVNPQPGVEQILELTRMNEVLEVVKL